VVHLSEGELEAGSEADEDFAGFLHGGGGSQAGYYGGSVGIASDGGAAGDDDVCILDGQWGGPPSSAGNRLQEMLDEISAPGSAESSPRGALEDPLERTQGPGPDASAGGGGTWHFAAPRRDAIHDRPVADHAERSDEAKVVRFEALLRARERTIKEQAAEIEALQSQLADTSGERDHLAQSRAEWQASSEQLAVERARLEGELARATSTVGALQAQGRALEEALAADKLSIDELQRRNDALAAGDTVLSAAKYEHHLSELGAEHRAALARVGEEVDVWRAQALALQELDAPPSADARDASTQAGPSAGPAVGDARGGGARAWEEAAEEEGHWGASERGGDAWRGMEEGHEEALLARIDALEGEVDPTTLGSPL
jgi:hypothetical protein